MMLIGRSSRRENLLRVTGIEPRFLIRTCPREPHQGQQPREWLHQQARHMTAPDRNRHHANSALDAGAPSTHDPFRPWQHTRRCDATFENHLAWQWLQKVSGGRNSSTASGALATSARLSPPTNKTSPKTSGWYQTKFDGPPSKHVHPPVRPANRQSACSIASA